MSDDMNKPMIVTLKDLWNKLEDLEDKIDGKVTGLQIQVNKLQNQVGMLWVTHGIVISVIVFAIQRGIAP